MILSSDPRSKRWVRKLHGYRRRAVNSLFQYKQGEKPNIVIFANRRGGSTILAEAININRGIWFVNEPFAFIEGHGSNTSQQRHMLQPKPHSIFLTVEQHEEASTMSYIDGLMHAQLRQNGYLRRPKSILVANRSLLKILNAGALIDWLAEKFDFQSVHLLRHPGAQALSVHRCGWEWSTPAFMQSPLYLDRYITDKQLGLIKRIVNSGSEMERGVLNWVLENLPLLRFPGSILRICYEDLVTDTEFVIDTLANYLNLEQREEMVRQVIGRPSGSSRGSTDATITAIKSGDRKAMIYRWLEHYDEVDLSNCQRILDEFEIDCYQMNSPYGCISEAWSAKSDYPKPI